MIREGSMRAKIGRGAMKKMGALALLFASACGAPDSGTADSPTLAAEVVSRLMWKSGERVFQSTLPHVYSTAVTLPCSRSAAHAG